MLYEVITGPLPSPLHPGSQQNRDPEEKEQQNYAQGKHQAAAHQVRLGVYEPFHREEQMHREQEGGDHQVQIRNPRITSYNVCYTKLLRRLESKTNSGKVLNVGTYNLRWRAHREKVNLAGLAHQPW